MGGKAKSSNLVPARGPETNTLFANQVELAAWNFREGKSHPARKPRDGNLVWYKVDVHFGHSDPAFEHFPNWLESRFGTYTWKRNQWEKTPPPSDVKNRGRYSQKLKPPDISGGPQIKIFYLDEDGRDRLRQIHGIEGYGETIWKERVAYGQFGTKTKLKERMRRRNKALPPQNKVKQLEGKLKMIHQPNVKMVR